MSPGRRDVPKRSSPHASDKPKKSQTAKKPDLAKKSHAPARSEKPKRSEKPASTKESLPGVRLQKLLSAAGVSSRRHAETLIQQGRVRVNGTAVTVLGGRVDPSKDVVELDGRRVETTSPRWILLNKPPGTLTTMSDPGGRPTVYSLLPRELRTLRYVGRLDLETEGLLLFTNQGDEINRLTHPSGGYEREYHVGVEGTVAAISIARLVKGVELEDGMAHVSKARLLKKETGGDVLSLVLLEGRKREVRRLLDAVGHGVRWLRRVRFGVLELGALAPGAWRDLTAAEVKRLLSTPKVEDERVRRGPDTRGQAKRVRERPAEHSRGAPAPKSRGPMGPQSRPKPTRAQPKDAQKSAPTNKRDQKIRRGPGARGRPPADR